MPLRIVCFVWLVIFFKVSDGLSSNLLQGQLITVSNPLAAGDQYSTYRIPGFAVANDGSLLLFAEGRPNAADPGGAGDIDLVFKRSTDNGVTWSDLSILKNMSGFDYSDPRVVIDENSGKVHLQYTQWPTNVGQAGVPVGLGTNSSVTFYQSSSDDGATWSAPANINAQVKDPSWASLNTGPGKGIQLKWQDSAAARNGRLVIPAHQRPAAYRGVALYSDDNGATWTRGSGTTPGFADESEVIELTNGDLLWDARQSSGNSRNRFLSTDGGETWASTSASGIPVTPVDTGMVRYSAKRAGDDRDRILYSAPLGSNLGTGNSRDNIGIWTSYDEGKSFINPVQIQTGSSAYSVVDRLSDGTIGLVYEVNHNTVRYVNFGLQHLEGSPQLADVSHYDGFGNTVVRSNGGVGWSGSWAGSGTFTANHESQFGGSNVSFENFRFNQAAGRLDLSGQSSRRTLATPIDLDANGTTYISLLASRALDGSADNSSQEFLDVLLQDAANVTGAAFGVGSAENLFVNSLGDVVSAGIDSFDLNSNYFLVAKIVSMDSAQGNSDQIFLKAFESGIDFIPDDDIGLDWTLIGTTNQNSSAQLTQLVLSGGSNATWSVDEIRIGTTWGAVASNIASVPEPFQAIPQLLVFGGLSIRRRRSRRPT